MRPSEALQLHREEFSVVKKPQERSMMAQSPSMLFRPNTG